MTHLPTLIIDLALILASAGIITLLFKWLKQPLVLGYIVAGLLAGPHCDLLPSVNDVASINTWADIGVVFLLFALGLEFSFKKLMNVGGTAVITAITEVICMSIIGFSVGQLLGWSTMESILLGGMLTISSTTIIIKTFDELGLRSQRFTGIVFGVLVVEDLVAILIMVLLSTVAATQNISGEAILESTLKLIFFLILWFVTGIFILPAFFRKMKKLMNDETLLVISLGLCLCMVVLATGTGFSAALGAFIMGSILAETVEAEHIEHLVRPVKDLFGAIFFVSVGMLIDPSVLVAYALPVLLISVVAILGKATSASLGVLLSGQSLKTSVQAGFSLGQIGEFAFIIGGLAVSLKVVGNFIYPIIVAVSVLTVFASPYVIKLSLPFFTWLEKVLPDNVKAFLDKYASGSNTINHDSDWKKLVKKFTSKIVIFSVLLTAIFLFAIHFLLPFVKDYLEGFWANAVTALIALALMSPFLVALLMRRYNSPELFLNLWTDSKYNRGRLVSLVLLRIFVAVFFVSLLLIQLFKINSIIGLVISTAVVSLVFLLRGILNQYSAIEKRFLENYNERENVEENKKSDFKKSFSTHLQDRDIHLITVEVSPDSPFVGKSLSELELRKNHGVNIVKIFRGATRINIPGGRDYLFPHDKLTLVGTSRKLKTISKRLKQHKDLDDKLINEVELKSFIVDADFPLLGQVVAEAHAKFRCLVVGMERDKESFYPETSHRFELGDLIWVVGEIDNINRLVVAK